MKHIVFCGAQGSGKTFQAERLMELVYDKEEYTVVEDNPNLNTRHILQNYDAVLVEGCKSAERVAWLAGQIEGYSLAYDKPFQVFLTTQDVEGAALLDRGVFRVLVCSAPHKETGTYHVESINN